MSDTYKATNEASEKPDLVKKISIVTCENLDTDSPMKVLNLQKELTAIEE